VALAAVRLAQPLVQVAALPDLGALKATLAVTHLAQLGELVQGVVYLPEMGALKAARLPRLAKLV
jgi:hypothetical protein